MLAFRVAIDFGKWWIDIKNPSQGLSKLDTRKQICLVVRAETQMIL